MEPRRHVGAVLALVLCALLLGEAKAQGLSTYFESSGTEHKPRSNAGVAVQNDWFRMRADVALRARAAQTASTTFALQPLPTGSTEVTPNLRSAFKIAKNLDLETRVNFAEWNADTDTTVDTRLRYRKSLGSFFDELDGSFWRSPEGTTNQTLRLNFDQVLGDPEAIAPLTITGQAIFEATQQAYSGASNDSRKVAIETKVAGFLSTLLTTDHALSFRAEKTVGTRPESASTLTYGQSWMLSPLAELGLDLNFRRQTFSPADDFEPSIGIRWRGEF